MKQVIDEWNPYGLLPAAPDDEFEREIEKIADSLIHSNTVDELALNIQNVFSTSFGEPFKYNNCLNVASKIWTLYRK